MPTSVSHFTFDYFWRYGGGHNIKIRACLSSQTPPTGQFFCRAKPASAYQCTKFQLPSWVSFGDMDGVQKSKLGAVDHLRRP